MVDFNERLEAKKLKKLDQLARNVRAFFQELKDEDLQDLAEKKLSENFENYHLTVDEVLATYAESPKQL